MHSIFYEEPDGLRAYNRPEPYKVVGLSQTQKVAKSFKNSPQDRGISKLW